MSLSPPGLATTRSSSACSAGTASIEARPAGTVCTISSGAPSPSSVYEMIHESASQDGIAGAAGTTIAVAAASVSSSAMDSRRTELASP